MERGPYFEKFKKMDKIKMRLFKVETVYYSKVNELKNFIFAKILEQKMFSSIVFNKFIQESMVT